MTVGRTYLRGVAYRRVRVLLLHSSIRSIRTFKAVLSCSTLPSNSLTVIPLFSISYITPCNLYLSRQIKRKRGYSLEQFFIPLRLQAS